MKQPEQSWGTALWETLTLIAVMLAYAVALELNR